MISNNLGEVCVTYKYHNSLKERPTISSFKDAHSIIKQLIPDETIGLQEQFVVLYLNNACKLIGTYAGFSGAINSTVVDFKIIAVTALKLMASRVIVAHNHPSGLIKPSTQDIALTERLKSSLKLLEIELIDHLIVGPEDECFSFAEERLMN